MAQHWKGPGLPSRPPRKDVCPVCGRDDYPRPTLPAHIWTLHGDKEVLISTILRLDRQVKLLTESLRRKEAEVAQTRSTPERIGA